MTMMEIPEGLAENLLPLAWTIGSWRGYGTLNAKFNEKPMRCAYEGAAADSMILQEMAVSAEGDKLKVDVRAFAATSDETIPVTASAQQGVSLLRRGAELWHEVSVFTIVSYRLGSNEEPTPHSIADIDVKGSIVAGKWEARTMGPRITARLLKGADPQMQATRMVGLVGGEFFWAQDRTLPNGEADTEFSARLARVVS